MSYKFSLLKIVPLAAVTVGLLAPIKIAEAASSSAPTDKASTIEHEVKEKGHHGDGHKTTTTDSHGDGYKTTAADSHGDSHGTTADSHGDAHGKTTDSHGDGHGTTAADSHGDSHGKTADSHGDGHGKTADSHGDGHGTTAADSHGDGHGASGVPQILLSPKAQRIEFFTFLGAIGLYIVIPELFYSPKKIAKNFSSLENEASLSLDETENTENLQEPQKGHAPSFEVIESSHRFESEQQPQEANTPSFEVIESSHRFESEQQPQEANTPSFEVVESGETTEELQEQVADFQPDIPRIRVVSSNREPYTIPAHKLNSTDTYGNIELENWSQPDRKAA